MMYVANKKCKHGNSATHQLCAAFETQVIITQRYKDVKDESIQALSARLWSAARSVERFGTVHVQIPHMYLVYYLTCYINSNIAMFDM